MTTTPLLFDDLPVAFPPAAASTGPGLAPEQRGAIGALATAYGVGTKADKADKTEENAAIAARFAAAYPSDRLCPMPEEWHADWSAADVDRIQDLSAQLASVGEMSTANLWRATLRRPRSRHFLGFEALERLLAVVKRQAAIAAGEDVDPGITFRDAPPPSLASPLPLEHAVQPSTRRRAKVAAAALSLSARMRAGVITVSVSWGNPYTTPPGGLARTVWAFSLPAGTDARAFAEDYAPAFAPGSGWVLGFSSEKPTRTRWSQEAKGRVRRRNLRVRLEKKVPLLADLFFEEQLDARPEYFAGAVFPCDASAPVAETVDPQLGHNGGPPLGADPAVPAVCTAAPSSTVPQLAGLLPRRGRRRR